MMNQFDLQDVVESLRDAELLRYAKEYVRLSIAESDKRRADAHSMVDLIYAECVRRGKEWLYDKAREIVHKETSEECVASLDTRRTRRGRSPTSSAEMVEDGYRRLSHQAY
jgi:hypothetical protein